MFDLATLVLAVATSVFVYLWRDRWRQRNQLVSKTWPYFGNLFEMRTNAARLYDWVYEYMSKSPTGTVEVSIGTLRAIMHRKLASYEFSSIKLREVSTEAYRELALRLLTFLDTVADSHKQVDIQDKHDLLSRFLSSKDQNGEPLSDKVLRDATVNFLLAGRDTTALTLGWFMYLLSCNPEVAQKCDQELNEVFGERETAQPDRWVQGSSRRLLINKFFELQDGKFAVDDDVLPDGTIVKRGEVVVYVQYAMGRMELLWGPDASQFRPERWLKDNVYQPESPFKFSAFQVVPNQDVAYRVSLVLAIRDGLQVTVQRR
ncbi:hypothetical protein AXG93_773s1310 [Marchantia polymorpha subsp. ruderalis]|uniref:Cytochrome P450 n=1 Tax=Marchantia polymorpha subsp. ruderalis TaxID=1480154 RepID=A0A176WB81_MARPO|nr:hypothetical protein AXG93_773s1310 [Marchantia polymorpha subsp. ruderalis]